MMQPLPAGYRPPPSKVFTASGAGARGPKLRILIAMQEGAERRLVASTLRSRGYETQVSDWTAIITALDRVLPGIVFLDRVDPLGPIRRHPDYEDIPVILIVDNEDQKVIDGYDASADLCFTRPLDLEDPVGIGAF